jgi:hypothetical protein
VHYHRTGFGNGHRNIVLPALERFSPLATALPPNSTVGYITDNPSFRYPRLRTALLNDELMNERLAAMPVVIAPSTELSILLGDFRDAQAAARIVREQNLSVIRDFGGGLMLLRRGGS